eukprot:4550091-Pleurochrysis_carterae.AAC.1
MCVAGACAVGTVNSALRNPVAAATTMAARSEVPRREDHSRGFGAAAEARLYPSGVLSREMMWAV